MTLGAAVNHIYAEHRWYWLLLLSIHAFQKLEKVTVGGQHQGGVIGNNGLVRLHGPGELVKLHGFSALIVSPGIDLGGFRICHATYLLDFPVGFRLYLSGHGRGYPEFWRLRHCLLTGNAPLFAGVH
jgi:hypothetical protein